jgi:hypothetical protein
VTSLYRGGILLVKFSRPLRGEGIIGALHILARRLDGRLQYTPITVSFSGSSIEERRYDSISLGLRANMITVHDPRDSSQLFSEVVYEAVMIHPDCEESQIISGMLEQAVLEFESRPSVDQDPQRGANPERIEYSVLPRNLDGGMALLVVIQGEYGRRILDWLKETSPPTWTLEWIELTDEIPEVVDNPRPFLPDEIPKADLLLFLSEGKNTPQLVSDIVKESEAVALIAPVDRTEWMPPGQITQIKRTMLRWGVETSFPRPFCSLEPSGSEAIDMFAEFFGKPEFEITTIDGRTVNEMRIRRGAPCGCTAFVAENIAGVKIDEAVEKAGLLHHHHPCLASMDREPDLDDTLMHFSGLILKQEVEEELGRYLKKVRNFVDPHQFKR